ncbi:hypothetical protein ACOMHN_026068 [Nucella lapillus]
MRDNSDCSVATPPLAQWGDVDGDRFFLHGKGEGQQGAPGLKAYLLACSQPLPLPLSRAPSMTSPLCPCRVAGRARKRVFTAPA